MYDPKIGQFLSRDPLGEGTNLHLYEDDNPESNLDPLGLATVPASQPTKHSISLGTFGTVVSQLVTSIGPGGLVFATGAVGSTLITVDANVAAGIHKTVIIAVQRNNDGVRSTMGTLTVGLEGATKPAMTGTTLEPRKGCYNLGNGQRTFPIPAGTYVGLVRQTVKNPSVKGHEHQAIELQNVGGNFSGILIHVGNKPEDTEGCILIGSGATKDWVSGSGDEVKALMDYLDLVKKADPQMRIRIVIKDAPGAASQPK